MALPLSQGLGLRIRYYDRWIEELSHQLSASEPNTSLGPAVTPSVAVSDLLDWMQDTRSYVPIQYNDWVQVTSDYRLSMKSCGPKLQSVHRTARAQVENLLDQLFTVNTQAGRKFFSIEPSIRASLSIAVATLRDDLQGDASIVAAWRDLLAACRNVKLSPDELALRRDTFSAIARSRGIDSGHYGVENTLRSIIRDEKSTILEERDRSAGCVREYYEPDWDDSGETVSERLQLCEEAVIRRPSQGDCIVWLRLDRTSLPQDEVTHGQITLYNAAWLSGHVGHPEYIDNFKVVPTEILTPPEYVYLPDGEVEWENNYNMVYARVLLSNVLFHEAHEHARTLVDALVSVNHPDGNDWRLLRGHLLFVDGHRTSLMSWGEKERYVHVPDKKTDSIGRHIEHMATAQRNVDSVSVERLKGALTLSKALKQAHEEGPEATVMMAVRAIEHVNVWATGGATNWSDFVSRYTKRANARIRFATQLGSVMRWAAEGRNLEKRPEVPAGRREELFLFVWPDGDLFNIPASIKYIDEYVQTYENKELSRQLLKFQRSLKDGQSLARQLNLYEDDFAIQLGRLRRLRNSAIHGGPTSEATCATVQDFAYRIGHQCLNEAMTAMLTGVDIRDHFNLYREDHIERFERIKNDCDYEALFVDAFGIPTEKLRLSNKSETA